MDSGRYATLWPFSKDSIWNLPIGAGAHYTPANITRARDWGMTVDQDVIILTPDAPRTKFWYNDDAWNGGSRCSVEGGTLFEAPIPPDFVVPAAHPGWTPNFATAILAGDNRTLIQGQPMARCNKGGDATIWWSQTREDLYGTGFSGGHGGSMLSSLGGTIRSGELVPGGAIRHAMKVNLDGSENLWYDTNTWGFRWPATAADSCAASCYRGKNPALRMGSLLALPPSIDIASMGLETEPGKIVARAFQDFGGYVVDNTGWSVYALSTEYSPQHGWLEDEFARAWGFPIDPAGRDNPWARDMDRIFLALNVVDNWDRTAWDIVRASNGTLGVGGGLPRVAWAPDFSGTIPPPDRTPPQTWVNLSGTIGVANWYTSGVTISLTAADDRSGVASIHIRIDGRGWTNYYWPTTVSNDGHHTVEFYTTDIAGNDGAVESIDFGIDTSGPAIEAAVTGTVGGDGWYRTPVTVGLTATDRGSGVASLEVRTDGGSWSAYTAPLAISTDGRHTVEYRATDLAGNTVNGTALDFIIDTLATPVSHTLTGSAGSSGWYVSSVSVTLAPVGPPGDLAEIRYALDGVWATYTGPITVDEGRHTLQYQARYAQGNLGSVESVAINVDRTAPTVLRADPFDPVPPDATISWTGSDEGSGVVRYEVSIDGGPFLSVGTATSVSGPWTPGTHVLSVRAFDAAGNVETATISFQVDVNAPRINPTTPAIGNHEENLARILIVVGTVAAIAVVLIVVPRQVRLRGPKGLKEKGPESDAKPPEAPTEASKGPEEAVKDGVIDATKEPVVEPPTEAPKETSESPPAAPAETVPDPTPETQPEKPPDASPDKPPENPPEKPPENPPGGPAGSPEEPQKEAPRGPQVGSTESTKDVVGAPAEAAPDAPRPTPISIEYLMEVPMEP